MRKIILSLLIATSVVNYSNSQETQSIVTDKSGDIVAPSKEMQTIILAGQLAKYGYENNSATALIQAAELYLSVGKQDFKPVSFTPGRGEETKKDEILSHNPKQILADAKELAGGDSNLLAIIERVDKKNHTRGAVGGPKGGEYRVFANSKDEYIVKFYANELATVIVSGDGDTDLDLYVYDENGNLILKDDDYSDDCVVSWTPKWTGQYIIKVVNRGNVYNHYAIVTN